MLSAVERCAAAGPLHELIARYPELREVMKFFNVERFVPVMVNTCTIPQKRDGTYMTDCLVYGIFVVDREEVARLGSTRIIRQDYFVAWLDGDKVREVRYYSGPREKAWRSTPPAFWTHIEKFCDEFAGPGNCYGCKVRDGKVLPTHWYSENDADLPMDPQPVWRLAFDLALAWARHMEQSPTT